MTFIGSNSQKPSGDDREISTLSPISPAARSLRNHMVFGVGVVVLMAAGLAGWLAVAQLSGAVVASGKMVVDSNVKDVQHPDGGIVGEIRVRDGDRVAAGDLLMRLDDTMARASLAITESQIDALSARRMRLIAERDGADDLTLPAVFAGRQDDPAVAELVAAERSLFAARRASLDAKKQQLQQRLLQLGETVVGMTAQKQAKEEESRHIVDELGGLEMLYDKQLVPITRVAALRREKASLAGQSGELIANIAGTGMQIAETEIAILQLDQDRQTEILTELSDIDPQLAELMQKQIALRDQLRRIDIRAPYDGTIYQMAVHTVGGVVAAGDRIMGIVPDNDELVIEAQLRPQDIDQVLPGQPAMLRFTAFNQRTTPELDGRVSVVAADLTRDDLTGEMFYSVRIRIDAGEISRLGTQSLMPGMPVEAFIATGERTALSYLFKPLSDQFARAFRED
ncbi:HlyD family type I secretion periplasmic adaptor subunit [Thalassospira sp.]|uniref:HlyD family type I secretion periplasmic adaptor subunit n=1 Tax=Thalassospira sp. TaxID=1912094 RepID=UPI00273309D7|nr:HlyD family type I secretion periplasmic adaptor subunit [Thalassospira sp.]MDP2699345.1 HlyD family type I secretion periplasmic adaptor subunit [Thalassospira sp.]